MDEITTTKVESRVKVVGIMDGERPAIMAVTRAINPSGVIRHFTQKVPVPDTALFRKLTSEVKKGDEITATIVTEWYEADYASYLAGYSTVSQETASPAAALSGTRG